MPLKYTCPCLLHWVYPIAHICARWALWPLLGRQTPGFWVAGEAPPPPLLCACPPVWPHKKNPKIPSGIKYTNVLSGLWKNGQTLCYSLFSFSHRMKQQAFSTQTSFSLEFKRKLEMRWGTYKIVSISRCVLLCLIWNLRTVLEIPDVFPSGQGGRHATACRSVFPTVPFFPLCSEFRPLRKRACFLHLCLCLFSSESGCFCVLA